MQLKILLSVVLGLIFSGSSVLADLPDEAASETWEMNQYGSFLIDPPQHSSIFVTASALPRPVSVFLLDATDLQLLTDHEQVTQLGLPSDISRRDFHRILRDPKMASLNLLSLAIHGSAAAISLNLKLEDLETLLPELRFLSHLSLRGWSQTLITGAQLKRLIGLLPRLQVLDLRSTSGILSDENPVSPLQLEDGPVSRRELQEIHPNLEVWSSERE